MEASVFSKIVTESIQELFEYTLILPKQTIESMLLKKPFVVSTGDLVSFIQIESKINIDFYLILSKETTENIVNHLFGEVTHSNTLQAYQDTLKELINIIVGTIKRKLSEEIQCEMNITLPQILESNILEKFDFTINQTTLFNGDTIFGVMNLIAIQR